MKRIEDMAPNYIKQPFMKEYLIPLMNLIRLVFIKFNEENDKDIYAIIDAYMTQNEARKGMDKGNPKYLNMGWKQVYNRTPIDTLDKGEKSDNIMLHWLADTYTYWQWAYNLSSEEIDKRCPAKQLAKHYYPFHEAGITTTCRKLTEIYFPEVIKNDNPR